MRIHAAAIARRGLRLSMLSLVSVLLLGAGAAAAQDETPDRDYWVHRYQTLKTDLEAMRTRVEGLEANYKRARRRNYPRGDALTEMRTELDEAQAELDALEEQWANFDEEARRAGAYPGWFRD